MTYAPKSLRDLADLWIANGGTNLGIVGDTRHAATGTSYHLGADQLDATAYSRQTARDKAGLTNAASAIDLGRLDGSLEGLQAFSVWLVAQAQANKPGTADMREIIYSPDGLTVWRWDRERGYASAPVKSVRVDGLWTQGDQGHRTHTHISWYRDAEDRDHTVSFRPYFLEVDMPGLSLVPIPPLAAGRATVPPTEVIRVSDSKRIQTTATAANRVATGPYDIADIAGAQRGYLVLVATGLAWVRESALTFTPDSDYNAGVDAAVAAAATARRP